MPSEYRFKMPADAPPLTFASLLGWIGEDYQRDLGKTVSIEFYGGLRLRNASRPSFRLHLYGVHIATIFPDTVFFPVHHDTHTVTARWLERIVQDNGIGSSVSRIARWKSDPVIQGPRGICGPLAVDRDRSLLVEGHSFSVNTDETTRRQAQIRAGIRQNTLVTEEVRKRIVIRTVLANRYKWPASDITDEMIDKVLAGPPAENTR